MSNETTFRATVKAITSQKVAPMKKKIEESFARRDAFEESQGLNLSQRNSYTKERDNMLGAVDKVARLFIACGVEPSAVIERKVAETKMFNAKALKKITELARFAHDGKSARVERVLKAFIACTIIATERGNEVVNNRVNMSFLDGRADLSKVITDADTVEALDKLTGDGSRHAAMTSGAATQSSQVRNVLDVLAIGEIRSTDKPRDAIALDLSHGLIADFRSAYMSA